MSRVQQAPDNRDSIPTTEPARSRQARPLQAELDRLAEEFRQLESRHADRIAAAAREAEESLGRSITERLNEEFDSKLETGVRMIREQMEERFETARSEWDTERKRLLAEIEDLGRLGDVGKLREETKVTEEALARIAKDIESMVEDPNIKLSELMRRNSEQAELRAYLRGLHFRSTIEAP